MRSFTLMISLLPLLASFTMADHFYTTDFHGELAPGAGYHLEGIQCYVVGAGVPNAVAMYRWYNSKQAVHFYTTDPAGELAASSGYDYEGIGFYLYGNEAPGTVPLYRWQGNGHFYSTNAAEGSNAGFSFEGVAGYVYPSPQDGFLALYRWYNNK